MHVVVIVNAAGEVGLATTFPERQAATPTINWGRFRDRPLFSVPVDPRVIGEDVYWDGQFAYNLSWGKFLTEL